MEAAAGGGRQCAPSAAELFRELGRALGPGQGVPPDPAAAERAADDAGDIYLVLAVLSRLGPALPDLMRSLPDLLGAPAAAPPCADWAPPALRERLARAAARAAEIAPGVGDCLTNLAAFRRAGGASCAVPVHMQSSRTTLFRPLETAVAGANNCVVEGWGRGRKAAVKVIALAPPPDCDVALWRRRFVDELSVSLGVTGGPHVVRTLGLEFAADAAFLLMDFADGGDLVSLIRRRGTLGEAEARHIFAQLVEALTFLHEEKGVVHRDVKPENVLLQREAAGGGAAGGGDVGCVVRGARAPAACGAAVGGQGAAAGSSGGWHAMLGDFGASTWLRSRHEILDEVLGTVAYAAPEVLAGQPYRAQPVDVWSLGVVLYTMLFGQLPWGNLQHKPAASLHESFRGIVETPLRLDRAGVVLSPDCANLLRGMLVLDPERRATLADVRGHAWTRGAAAGTAVATAAAAGAVAAGAAADATAAAGAVDAVAAAVGAAAPATAEAGAAEAAATATAAVAAAAASAAAASAAADSAAAADQRRLRRRLAPPPPPPPRFDAPGGATPANSQREDHQGAAYPPPDRLQSPPLFSPYARRRGDVPSPKRTGPGPTGGGPDTVATVSGGAVTALSGRPLIPPPSPSPGPSPAARAGRIHGPTGLRHANSEGGPVELFPHPSKFRNVANNPGSLRTASGVDGTGATHGGPGLTRLGPDTPTPPEKVKFTSTQPTTLRPMLLQLPPRESGVYADPSTMTPARETAARGAMSARHAPTGPRVLPPPLRLRHWPEPADLMHAASVERGSGTPLAPRLVPQNRRRTLGALQAPQLARTSAVHHQSHENGRTVYAHPDSVLLPQLPQLVNRRVQGFLRTPGCAPDLLYRGEAFERSPPTHRLAGAVPAPASQACSVQIRSPPSVQGRFADRRFGGVTARIGGAGEPAEFGSIDVRAYPRDMGGAGPRQHQHGHYSEGIALPQYTPLTTTTTGSGHWQGNGQWRGHGGTASESPAQKICNLGARMMQMAFLRPGRKDGVLQDPQRVFFPGTWSNTRTRTSLGSASSSTAVIPSARFYGGSVNDVV